MPVGPAPWSSWPSGPLLHGVSPADQSARASLHCPEDRPRRSRPRTGNPGSQPGVRRLPSRGATHLDVVFLRLFGLSSKIAQPGSCRVVLDAFRPADWDTQLKVADREVTGNFVVVRLLGSIPGADRRSRGSSASMLIRCMPRTLAPTLVMQVPGPPAQAHQADLQQASGRAVEQLQHDLAAQGRRRQRPRHPGHEPGSPQGSRSACPTAGRRRSSS
jgi:hypothetical protein